MNFYTLNEYSITFHPKFVNIYKKFMYFYAQNITKDEPYEQFVFLRLFLFQKRLIYVAL